MFGTWPAAVFGGPASRAMGKHSHGRAATSSDRGDPLGPFCANLNSRAENRSTRFRGDRDYDDEVASDSSFRYSRSSGHNR
jgi:hypothetical protein